LGRVDFDAVRAELEGRLRRKVSRREVISYLLYPKVFLDYSEHLRQYSDVSVLPTPVFFYGMQPGQEIAVDIEPGKTLIIKFLAVGEPDQEARRTIFFELNGQPREVKVVDRSLASAIVAHPKAEADNPYHVPAPFPGRVVSVSVSAGDSVERGQRLLSLEAMKMETTIYAEREGKIAQVLVKPGFEVDSKDLLIVFADERK